MKEKRAQCPCCGYFTLHGRGEYDICPVCWWEDDDEEEVFGVPAPERPEGPNHVHLWQARENFAASGASEERFRDKVRPPRQDEMPAAPDLNASSRSGYLEAGRQGAAMGGWIFEQNLKPFVALVAHLAGYARYDEDYDWLAIEYGIEDTDEHAGRWYAYPFAGTHPLVLELARNPGSRVVSVRATNGTAIEPEVAAQFHLLITICQEYEVRPRG